ncbi:Mevalonate kinase [Fructilactobacillus florum 8D]|uniref:mevalonate kinase n=1 Tax=Fructilactobacillus florum 8D TaxID=1221538 RepID=W9EI15_9LACO|nr:mevalonate kinase [Fructilactobacillus florum]EKK20959.1 Mevalonate kinase [Fructilactobacillus florum 2F]ETO40640.1 Mevalonate kinase [Fructilactobacillus florum 8D]
MLEYAVGTSHAKVIFLGEHSAVYRQPALVFPLPGIQTIVTISPAPTKTSALQSDFYTGALDAAPEALQGLLKLQEQLDDKLNPQHQPLKFTVESNIPVGRGMGSSAATASALTKAYHAFFSADLSAQNLGQFTDLEEQITHGNPSGIDAKTVNANQPILYQHHQFQTIDFQLAGYLVIADTGQSSATKVAVAQVTKAMQTNPAPTQAIIEHLGLLVQQSLELLRHQQLNQTGKLLTAAHRDLQKLAISTTKLDLLVQTALENGALGAKLTGSGLGGCLLALTDNQETADYLTTKLRVAGAVKTWKQNLADLNP